MQHKGFQDREVIGGENMAERKKAKKAEQEKIEPVYERLAPDEALIISKKGNCVTYATNKKGKIVLKETCLRETD